MYLNTEIMKLGLLLFVLFLVSTASSEDPNQLNPIMAVGQIMAGKIDPEVTNQKIHPFNVGQPQRKYLFIRLNTPMANQAAIGVYSNMTG